MKTVSRVHSVSVLRRGKHKGRSVQTQVKLALCRNRRVLFQYKFVS